MEKYNVSLLFKDAKFTDLFKFFLAYANQVGQTDVPGVSSLVGVAEKYIKKLMGGLPIECKMNINEDNVTFTPNWGTALFFDSVKKITIPYSHITGVQCIKDNRLSVMYFPRKIRKLIINTINGDLVFIKSGVFILDDHAETIREYILSKKRRLEE